MNVNHQIQKKTKGWKCEMKNKKFFLITGIVVCILVAWYRRFQWSPKFVLELLYVY